MTIYLSGKERSASQHQKRGKLGKAFYSYGIEIAQPRSPLRAPSPISYSLLHHQTLMTSLLFSSKSRGLEELSSGSIADTVTTTSDTHYREKALPLAAVSSAQRNRSSPTPNGRRKQYERVAHVHSCKFSVSRSSALEGRICSHAHRNRLELRKSDIL
jgi:hypothetical protein